MIYTLARELTRIGLSTRIRLRVEGAENVPRKGAAVIAANHVSALDPPIVGLAIRRPVHFMAKAELFASFWSRALFNGILCIPVRRGLGDRQAIRRSLEVLNGGRLLGIFPEGTRSKSEDMQALRGGAAMLAIKARAPIIPVAVVGTRGQPLEGSGTRRLVIVRFGRPLLPGPGDGDSSAGGEKPGKVKKEEIDKLSHKLAGEISALYGAGRSG